MSTPTTERGLPHDWNIEKVLLGTLIASGDVSAVADRVKPSDFHKPTHELIYEHILACAAEGEAPSPARLLRRIESSGGMEALATVSHLGPVHYIMSLPSHGVIPEMFGGVVQDLLRDSRRRAAVLELRALEERLLTDVDVDPAVGVLEMQARLDALQGPSTENTWRSIQGDLDAALVDIQRRTANPGSVPGLSTGWPELDRRIGGLQPGKVYVLAARPKVGKSVVAQNIAMHIARQGFGVGFVSLEMSGSELAERAFAQEGHVDAGLLLRGEIDADHDWPRVLEARARMEGLPFYVNDRPGQSIGQLRTEARQLVRLCEQRGHPLRLLVIDYLQLMGSADRAMSREQVVAGISRGVKLLAKELQVPIVLLSQLNRSLESRTDKRPMTSDLRESGAIEQDADAVIFLHREEVYDPATPKKGIVEVIVSAVRGGSPGTVYLAWIGAQYRVSNLAHGYTPPPVQADAKPQRNRSAGRRRGDPEDT